MADDPAVWLREYLDRYNLSALPISHDHALAVLRLPPKHNDPFDRMLIAQALCEGMTLASADQSVRQYDVPLLP